LLKVFTVNNVTLIFSKNTTKGNIYSLQEVVMQNASLTALPNPFTQLAQTIKIQKSSAQNL